jgi:hypothetical protein
VAELAVGGRPPGGGAGWSPGMPGEATVGDTATTGTTLVPYHTQAQPKRTNIPFCRDYRDVPGQPVRPPAAVPGPACRGGAGR